jgi:hypothetical protein
MKIIITESQYSMLSEENLRKFCYAVWDKQKKKGEEPHMDDVIYDVTGIRKNSTDDFEIIRPIWYEYNGGFMNIFKRMKNEIEGKTFQIVDGFGNLNTKIKIYDLEPYGTEDSGRGVEILTHVDEQGTMDFFMYEEGTDNEIEVNDTIEAAYVEALANYESSDLFGYLRGEVFTFLLDKLEKYGIPIDVDVDLKEFIFIITMGPIEKKIFELLKTEGLSEETVTTLTMIKNQVREDEKLIVNEAYQKGYHDKEMSRRPTWNYFDSKYKSFFTNFRVGQL